MKKIKKMKLYSQVANGLMRRIGFHACTAAFLLLFAFVFPGHAASITPSVPSVVYVEPAPDLEVKVLGGKIVIQRTFAEGKWHPNYNWANIHFTFDSFDGSVKTITRGKAEYTKTAPGVFGYRKRDTIRQTGSGFRWQDRSGNWIEYDAQGQIQSYGDRNDVRVSFTYETVGTGKRISGIKDHLDNQVLWYEYTGDLLTAIRDYSNRRVEHRYTNNQLSSVVDANGNTWIYGYTGSLPTTFTDPENRTITRAWVGNGELASLRYADGTGVDYKYEYDSSKTLFYKQERTTGGRVTESWINPDGEIVRQDLNGKSIKTLITDTYARTRTETDARGLATIREYDQWDNVTKITYPDGTTVTTMYDPIFSQPTQKTDERGVITKYEYDTKGNLVLLTEALGMPEQRVTEYTYDQYGRMRTETRRGNAVTLPDNAGTVTVPDVITTYEYDDYGNVMAIIDAESYRTEYDNFDAMGNARIKRDARNKIWTRTYDNRGNLKTDSDPLNHTTTTTYDKVGWRIKVTDAVNNDSIYGYDTRGNVITITDAYGGITRHEYNSDNQRTKYIDQEGKIQTIEYDLDGRPTKQIDGNNNAIRYEYGDETSGFNNLLVKISYPTFSQEFKYDNRNRNTEVIDVIDTNTQIITRKAYDASGHPIATTDKENKVTSYEYDALGRPVRITDPAQGITNYVYDSHNNTIALRDPKSQLYRFEYDRRNLKIRETRPMGQTIIYIYDSVGNLDSVTDAKDQVKRYSYDDVGRKIEENHFLSASAAMPVKTVSYGYNNLGALNNWNDNTASGAVNYDSRQLRIMGETVNYGTFTLSYSYDYYANGLKKSFTGPDNVTVNYAYDTTNLLSSIALPIGSITVNQYHWTAPALITFPGGTTRRQNYDSLMRLTSISVKDPAQNEVMNYSYTYDKADNIKAKTTESGNYIYEYDDLYRLTNATNPAPLINEAYTYDPVGNRLTDNSVSGNWQYNSNNQLTSFGSITQSYDDNGNITTKTEGTIVTTYIYDTNNRLIEVTRTDTATNVTTVVATYNYDPLGRRLSKNVNNASTYYLYSEEGLIAEANSAGVAIKLYGYKPNSGWGINPIYVKEENNYYFFLNDYLGTPQQLINQTGGIIWQAKIQAFGATTVESSSTATNNLRFPGQYYDVETDLHYNLNRYYDSSQGRYITQDPIGLEGGLNVYIYAAASPIRNYDESGLYCVTEGLITIPGFTRVVGSLTRNGQWHLYHVHVSPTASRLLMGWPGGRVDCYFQRSVTTTTNYEKKGTEISWGWCIDECGFPSVWGDVREVVLRRWSETKTKNDKDVETLPISSPTAVLGMIKCREAESKRR